MISVLKWLLTILLTIVMVSTIFASNLPIWVSIVLSLFSVVLFWWICKDDSVKKPKLCYIKNFVILVFWNILLFPYIENIIVQILVLVLVYIIGIVCLLFIHKGQENRNYFKKAIEKYCMYTIVPGGVILIVNIITNSIL